MTQPTHIRVATQDDLEFAFPDSQIDPAVRRRLVAEGDVLIAEAGGEPVGFLRLEWIWSKLPFIAMIWVLPSRRKLGVGSALLEHLAARLRGQGHAVLYSSSEAHAAEAQAWHRRQGFEECGFIAGINSGGVGEVYFRRRL